MKESVSAVFVTSDKVFFIKRQNYLSVFPGYYATPGGKVDKTDPETEISEISLSKKYPKIIHAMIRELKEELNFDLLTEIKNGNVLNIDDIGIAITPEFNPYRFKNYYFKITLKREVEFDLDKNEVEFGEWSFPKDLLTRYEQGYILAVPPAIVLLKTFASNIHHNTPISMTLPHDPETEVAMIESLYGVRQFLPLSNTFPPANRTNSFIIGDSFKVLIDPSPKDEVELNKFLKSVNKIGFDAIMLTHHHPDHYEYSDFIAKKYQVPIYLSEDTYQRIGENYFNGIKIHFLKEGDILTQSLGRDIFVYHVPGHDEGQLALAPKSMEWFLVGDLIQTIGTVAILEPEGNMQKYFASLSKVMALNPKNIIPSHGIILGGIFKIEETLKHRMMRENQIIECLNLNLSEEEMINKIYPDLEVRLIPYAKKTIQAHLKKIIDEKKVN